MTYNLSIVSVPEDPSATPSGLQGLGGAEDLGFQRVREVLQLPTRGRICYHLEHRYVSLGQGVNCHRLDLESSAR